MSSRPAPLLALLSAGLALLTACSAEAPTEPAPAVPPSMILTGLDHMPVAVADLEAAEARFRALGFTLKPGRYHANGIRNAHAKFLDTSYIELITIAEPSDALTAAYAGHLADGDGPAYLAFGVSDVAETAAALGPYGQRIDAGDGYVAFREEDPLATYFFGVSGRAPTDRPEHFDHANSAQSLERVWLAPDEPDAVVALLERLGARFEQARACLVECGPARTVALGDQKLVIAGANAQTVRGRPIIGATVRVASLDRAREAIAGGGVPESVMEANDERILVAPSYANGLWLEFREAGR